MGCVTSITYYTKFLVVTLLPIGLFIVILFFYLVPVRLYLRRDFSDEQDRKKAMKRAEKSFWKLVLFTVFLLYPSVSRFVSSAALCCVAPHLPLAVHRSRACSSAKK